MLEKKTLKIAHVKQGEAINNQLTIQKYEEVRLTVDVSGYNAWVRKMIMEEGIASFVQCPIPDKLPTHTCQGAQLFCEPTYGIVRDKLADVLMTVVLNLMTKEVAI